MILSVRVIVDKRGADVSVEVQMLCVVHCEKRSYSIREAVFFSPSNLLTNIKACRQLWWIRPWFPLENNSLWVEQNVKRFFNIALKFAFSVVTDSIVCRTVGQVAVKMSFKWNKGTGHVASWFINIQYAAPFIKVAENCFQHFVYFLTFPICFIINSLLSLLNWKGSTGIFFIWITHSSEEFCLCGGCLFP